MFRRAIDAAQAASPDRGVFAPVLYDAGTEDGRAAVLALLESGDVTECQDYLFEQVIELVHTRNPSVESPDQAFLESSARAHLGEVPVEAYGTWVYYPWSRRLLHVLPEAEYRELRTDRNRYKITGEEQTQLRTKRVGVVGLSVGHSAALTLAAEGVGGSFRLADFDELSLSNLNRIRTGTHNLGLNKAVIAAREMFEIDPYLDIEVFEDGIHGDNLGAFLDGGAPLDLLVEECDDLFVKVRIREHAKRLGIPVVMDTSDRGLLDVERFDHEPDRPIFHGLVGNVSADDLKSLTSKEKVPYVLRILGRDRMSPRLLGSMLEVKESLHTWPQLASGVTLGGALVTDTARRILLGTLVLSGRFYVDVASIVRDGGSVDVDLSEPFEEQISDEAREAARLLVPEGAVVQSIGRETIEALVAAAVRAPSAGNGQPWRFVARGRVVECRESQNKQWSTLDFGGTASRMAMGAAVENLVLAARRFGLIAEVSMAEAADGAQDGSVHVADVVLSPGGGRPDPGDVELFEQIGERFSDRHQGPREVIESAALEAMATEAAGVGARLQWLTGDEQIAALADVMAEGDRLTFLDPRMHSEMVAEFRWSRSEVEATRDGLDVATLELSAVDRAGLGVIAKPGAMRVLGAIGAGRGLGSLTRKWLKGASAMGLLSVRGTELADYFRGGRALQRLWLRGCTRAVGLHPMTGLPYLFARLERGGSEGLSTAQIATLRTLRAGYRELFELADDEGEVLLFRVLPSRAPKARSLRRHTSDILTFV